MKPSESMINAHVHILQRNAKQKLWRDTPDRFEKWNALIVDLCNEEGVEVPTLVINPDCRVPHYVRGRNVVTLNKYSIISLLHELGHHFRIDEGNGTHDDVFAYSERVFTLAFPILSAKLVRDSRNYLVKK